jgi:serpin B
LYKLIVLLTVPFFLIADSFIDALNNCSMTIFYLYGQTGYNRVYSPFATHSALLALYAGAGGESEANLREFYALHIPQSAVPASYYDIYNKLDQSAFLLNSLWTVGNTPILSTYQDILSKYFKTQLLGVNLSDPSQAALAINAFALKKLTKEVRPFVSVSGPFSLLSVNGLNYSLKWESPFLTKYSNTATFYPKSGDSPCPARMISKTGTFNYYEDESFQILGIPLEKKGLNDRLQFLVFLPKPHISNEPFEYFYNELPKSLNLPSLLKPKNVNVQIPSFDFQMDASLVSTLTSLSIGHELSSSANFSLISKKSALYISDFITTTKISINEFGLGVSSGSDEEVFKAPSKEQSLLFKANRPFMYMIYDTDLNFILTIGVYTSPNITAPPPPPKIKPDVIAPSAPSTPPPPAPQPYPTPQPYPKPQPYGTPIPDDSGPPPPPSP